MFSDQTSLGVGYTTRRLPSGAGHDAQMLARVCPTAMIFVPSVDGLSHNTREKTSDEDVAAGAAVLFAASARLAGANRDGVPNP